MATSIYPKLPSSGTPFMDGELFVNGIYDAFAESFDEILATLIHEAVEMATEEVRSYARKDKQWAPYANLLEVRFNAKGGTFDWVAEGTDEQIEAIRSLEYGGPHSPSGLLRKRALKDSKSIGKGMTRTFSAAVGAGDTWLSNSSSWLRDLMHVGGGDDA